MHEICAEELDQIGCARPITASLDRLRCHLGPLSPVTPPLRLYHCITPLAGQDLVRCGAPLLAVTSGRKHVEFVTEND